VNAGDSITLPSSTRSGYTLNGWYTASSGETKVGNAGASYTPSASVTLYAQWTASGGTLPTQYTITFNSQSGSAVTAITANIGTAVAKPADPTRTNYTFNGWYSATSGGTQYTWPHTLNKNVTMHAQWTRARYTITFDSQGGSLGEHGYITADAGSSVSSPTPIRRGYTFNGWYNAASDGTKYSWPYTLNGNVTMYAQWTENAPTQYTITFDSQGGSAVAAITANIGTAVQQPADPTKKGYIFSGWYMAPGGGAGLGWPFSNSVNMTVYAKWTANTSGVTVQITLQPQPSDPPLVNKAIFTDEEAQFSAAGNGYTSWKWYLNGLLIDGATSSDYTLAASSKPAGIYELSVVVSTGNGEKLSARSYVTIKAR
jgi:uncharacterized repeat protein (TIGR02543 family)